MKRAFLSAGAILIVTMLGLPSSAGAAKITVTLTADEFGTGSFCALREAVQAANTDTDFGGCIRVGTGTEDTILLEGNESYSRSIGGAEDANIGGDLDITGPTRIKVVGDTPATIDANDLDRVIEVHEGARLEASHLVITDGTALVPHTNNSGGGINNRGRLELSDSTISFNEITSNQGCTCGGGLANWARADLRNVLVTQNRSTINFGGGIADIGDRLNVVRSTIDLNFGGNGAGVGFSLPDGGTAKIIRTTISNNEALTDSDDHAGGIYTASFGSHSIELVNVTLSGNKANTSGGGIDVYAGTLDLNAVTVTNNIADYDENGTGNGGGISGNIVNFRNSIVAGNDAPTDLSTADCTGGTGLGHNLVGMDTGCFPGPGGKRRLDPLLGPLADNGGPNLTHKLRRGSTAIGLAGASAPSKDQRGHRRDANPDTGSYER